MFGINKEGPFNRVEGRLLKVIMSIILDAQYIPSCQVTHSAFRTDALFCPQILLYNVMNFTKVFR